MKPLPKIITKFGDTLRQVKRQGNVAIYSRGNSFEVVVIQQNEAWIIAGNTIPARESYPPSESWGTKGFTCMNMESAEAKFQELIQRVDTSKS